MKCVECYKKEAEYFISVDVNRMLHIESINSNDNDLLESRRIQANAYCVQCIKKKFKPKYMINIINKNICLSYNCHKLFKKVFNLDETT